jgi:cell division protein FtsB
MSDVKPVGFVQKAKLERLVSGYSVVAALYKDNFADEVPIYSQKTITALQAEIEAMRKDVERLEYLANDMQDMTFNGVEVLDFIEEDCDWPKAWRKAIDAAIAKEKQP